MEDRFKNFLRSYALAYNKEQGRTGSLFEKGFKRIRVADDRYFTAVICYIHNNPVHHRYTWNSNQWQFSSYNTILSDKTTKVQRAEVLQWFAGIEEFVAYHQESTQYDKIKQYLFLE